MLADRTPGSASRRSKARRWKSVISLPLGLVAVGRSMVPVTRWGGFPTETAVVPLVESAHEDGGTREEDHGERELAGDEDSAEALMAAISSGAANRS